MLTLEERERRAYITNSPDHALIVEAMDGDKEKAEEIKDLKKEVDDEQAKAGRLEDELQAQADALEKVEAENDELQQRIHESGVDLVA